MPGVIAERCLRQIQRGNNGAAVGRKTTLQGSFSPGTARGVAKQLRSLLPLPKILIRKNGDFYFLPLTTSLLTQNKIGNGFLRDDMFSEASPPIINVRLNLSLFTFRQYTSHPLTPVYKDSVCYIINKASIF